jgi:hypothetical protein
MRAACYLFTNFFSILTYCTILVSAYGDYGAYERVFYYYVYRIDAAGSKNGVPSQWAVACGKVIGTGGRLCNFNQFIQYINAKKGADMISLPDIHNDLDNMPPVRATADRLQTLGLTGTYDKGRMFNGVGNVEELIDRAMYVVENRLLYGAWSDTAHRDALRRGAFDAMKAIHHLRLKARSEHLLKAWEREPTLKDIRPTTVSRTLETGETAEIYDPGQTMNNNPTKREAIKAFHKKEDKIDPTHAGNVKRANDARNQLDPNHANSIQCG